MPLLQRKYAEIRDKARAGDIIAFGGKGNFSEIIKWATRASVSHVGIVLQSELRGAKDLGTDGYFNQIIESTSLNGFSGVTISRLSDRVDTYPGEIWWLPLGSAARKQVDDNLSGFYGWCLKQDHKPYDMPQAVASAMDALDRVMGPASVTLNNEDFAKFFCSELAAGSLEQVGAIPHVNASEVTPVDLCSFSIYEEDYVQIGGKARQITSYNTIDPRQWARKTGALAAIA